VFVSTVRSRHRVSQMADCLGEFGFLSEAKLVNTALTRAKSWLAVVGDPVALCSVGNCGALWRTYLKHCQKVGGVHPSDLSLEDIWQHSQSLMNLLSVHSVNADSTATLQTAGHSQAPAWLSVTPADLSDTVSLPTSGQSELPPSVSALQQITDSITADAKTTATKGTASRTGNTARAKARGRQDRAKKVAERVKSEESSSDEENDDDDDGSHVKSDTRLSAKSCSTTSDQRVTSINATAAAAAATALGNGAIISFAEWSLDYQLEPDEIIRQLAMVCIPAYAVVTCEI